MLEYKVFGCKTNKYFTEKWMDHPFLEGKGGIFIASCVVTDKAKAKWVKFARKRLEKLPKDAYLFLSGCGNLKNGMIDPYFFETYHELADYKEQIVLLPEDPEDYVNNRTTGLQERIRKFQVLSSKKQIFTRKYMVIQMGCDNFCTFCLTVQARGRHKWRPEKEILEEIQHFTENGGKEIVLTGTNLGAWGADSSNDYHSSQFVSLIHTILASTTIERIRISSLGVEFLNDDCIKLFGKKRINAYVHLSIQSGSSDILKGMNRHYDAIILQDVLKKLRAVQREDGISLNIGADIIVGFPGESEEDQKKSEALIHKYGITQLHAFPFSAHEDHYSIPAGKYEQQIPEHIKSRRLNSILSIGGKELSLFLQKHDGIRLRVLIEKTDEHTIFQGWSENYISCNEGNFTPDIGSHLCRGNIITGIYKYIGINAGNSFMEND